MSYVAWSVGAPGRPTNVLTRRWPTDRTDDDEAFVLKRPAHEDAYSVRQAGVARFAVSHKRIVIGTWLGLAVVLASPRRLSAVSPRLKSTVCC